ncbi:hypothetical protein KIL84_001854 [Mauremys mutica]|uniref:Uncharacterized protein n=1 Tax=Mauremys mutica TaxID=74926 RepID=A0A9D3XKU3_9SAUR|nr:hypothetical protein KIL84_001854 [Mauremys mutica]
MGHGSGETAIATDNCGHKNDTEEKHEARSLSQVLLENLDPNQGNPNDSSKGMYDGEAQQLSNGSLEDLEILDTDSSEGTNGLGPICFCPDPKTDAQRDAKREGDAYSIGLYYLTLRKKYGIEPVQVHQTITHATGRVAVHRIIKYCLRGKQIEDCPG